MSERTDSPDFETFQEMSRAFWENWMETGLKAFEEGAETAAKAWGEAAEAWHSWLPHEHLPAGPSQVMESLARQGKTFLELGESMARAGKSGDWSETLDQWLDSFSGANAPTAGAFGLPADALKHLGAPGGAVDPTRLLSMPTLGYTREHEAAQQRLAKAQIEFQQVNARYNALMERALRDGAGRFRDKLSAYDEPGRQITSLRALYDLWVDAAEEAFAEAAFSAEFRKTYGELVNALMRLRRAWLDVAEPGMKLAGVATRTELDDTTRQLHDLRRELSRVKAAMSAVRSGGTSDESRPAGRKTKKKTAKKKASKKKTSRKSGNKG